MRLALRITFMILLGAFCGGAIAQIPALDDPDKPRGKEDLPKNMKETLERMRIDQDKKEYKEMLTRGEEAVKLSDELQHSFAETGKLSNQDMAKLARVEKLVRK